MRHTAVHPLNIDVRELERPASHAAGSSSSQGKNRDGVPIIGSEAIVWCPFSLPKLPGISRDLGFPLIVCLSQSASDPPQSPEQLIRGEKMLKCFECPWRTAVGST